MVIIDQNLWSEQSIDIFIWSVAKHYSREHSFIHFNVLLSGQVMKKCRNSIFWSKYGHFWPEIVILAIQRYFIGSVSKHNSSEHTFIHFNALLSGQVMKKWQKWSKMPFSGQKWSLLTSICDLSHPMIFESDAHSFIHIKSL